MGRLSHNVPHSDFSTGALSRLQSFLYVQAPRFARHSGRSHLSLNLTESGCDFYVRAPHGSLPHRAPDMLVVRTGQLTTGDSHPLKLAALSAAPFACARLSESYLPRSSAVTFPKRSLPWLFTNAALGGLKPAPVSRLRGARPHLLCSYAHFILKVRSWRTSGRPEEFHLQSPSDPYVNLSIHTAPASLPLETSRSHADAERNPVPPSCLVDHRLPRAGSSPSLQPHYRTFNTTTG